jgi:hypothetical protein
MAILPHSTRAQGKTAPARQFRGNAALRAEGLYPPNGATVIRDLYEYTKISARNI